MKTVPFDAALVSSMHTETEQFCLQKPQSLACIAFTGSEEICRPAACLIKPGLHNSRVVYGFRHARNSNICANLCYRLCSEIATITPEKGTELAKG